MYFYYQQNMVGEWHPRKSIDRPTKKGPNGAYSPFKGLVELRKGEEDCTLDELVFLYPRE